MKHIYESLCFECKACEQSCYRKAITMKEDYEGFSYPIIDHSLCVDCGICQKVCPGNHVDKVKQDHLAVYAAQAKDKWLLQYSSSGGMFSLIASYVIKKGGIVYGAVLDNHLHCHHIGIDNLEGLNRMRGSKYVHSDIGKTFIEVRENLKSGRWVYYTGTPCQIAGLKLFLRKEYETLITSDVICHGTPSQKAFTRFVRGMEEDVMEHIVDWRFRDKKVAGWACSSSSSMDEKGHQYFANINLTAYFQAFIQGHLFRMDCYQCPFASPRRVSDITIADYWGVGQFHKFQDIEQGISMVIINSKKAETIWDNIKANTIFQKSKMEYALKTTNRNLYQCSVMPDRRKEAYNQLFYDYKGFCKSYSDNYHPLKLYVQYFLRNTIIGKLMYVIRKRLRT